MVRILDPMEIRAGSAAALAIPVPAVGALRRALAPNGATGRVGIGARIQEIELASHSGSVKAPGG
jgi:hypothetical protein